MNPSRLLIVSLCALATNAGAVAEAQPRRDLDEFRRRVAADSTLRPADSLGPSRFLSVDPRHLPAQGATDVFKLSQDYPPTYDPHEVFPWQSLDYRIHPEFYLRTVLNYCLTGNVEVNFKVQNNETRKWYHAPWLHDDGEPNGAGREYHRGLTRERRSRPQELHPQQTDFAQNWAVGMVNPRGGYVLGKVWLTPDNYPNPAAATFPDNTVSFKLLFTDAPDAQVPFLKNSLQWLANIYTNTDYVLPRVDRYVRLLQIDVAVKDPRVSEYAGWIFGTFVYDGDFPGATVWDRMQFVGLSWGDDVDVTAQMNVDGAFENGALRSTAINPRLIETPSTPITAARMRHFGLGGRLNGPVDSPVSSCISCHGRAATYAQALPLSVSSGLPMEFVVAGIRKPSDFPATSFDRYFRPIRPNSQLQQDASSMFVTTDYSLQVSAGIRNFYQNLRAQPSLLNRLHAEGLTADTPSAIGAAALPKVTRGD